MEITIDDIEFTREKDIVKAFNDSMIKILKQGDNEELVVLRDTNKECSKSIVEPLMGGITLEVPFENISHEENCFSNYDKNQPECQIPCLASNVCRKIKEKITGEANEDVDLSSYVKKDINEMKEIEIMRKKIPITG